MTKNWKRRIAAYSLWNMSIYDFHSILGAHDIRIPSSPRGTRMWAVGNIGTCSAQGFLLQVSTRRLPFIVLGHFVCYIILIFSLSLSRFTLVCIFFLILIFVCLCLITFSSNISIFYRLDLMPPMFYSFISHHLLSMGDQWSSITWKMLNFCSQKLNRIFSWIYESLFLGFSANISLLQLDLSTNAGIRMLDCTISRGMCTWSRWGMY